MTQIDVSDSWFRVKITQGKAYPLKRFVKDTERKQFLEISGDWLTRIRRLIGLQMVQVIVGHAYDCGVSASSFLQLNGHPHFIWLHPSDLHRVKAVYPSKIRPMTSSLQCVGQSVST